MWKWEPAAVASSSILSLCSCSNSRRPVGILRRKKLSAWAVVSVVVTGANAVGVALDGAERAWNAAIAAFASLTLLWFRIAFLMRCIHSVGATSGRPSLSVVAWLAAGSSVGAARISEKAFELKISVAVVWIQVLEPATPKSDSCLRYAGKKLLTYFIWASAREFSAEGVREIVEVASSGVRRKKEQPCYYIYLEAKARALELLHISQRVAPEKPATVSHMHHTKQSTAVLRFLRGP